MPIKVRPLTPVFGAEITNIDLSSPLDAKTVTEVKEAFEDHSVLLFPNQNIEDEAHLAFTVLFGPVDAPRKTFTTYHHKPFVNAVTNFDAEGNLYDEDDSRAKFRKGQRMWHTDGSFKAIPSIASLLRARMVPPEGGHTQFASLRAAYNTLPDDKKIEYENTVAVHHYAHSRRHMNITFMSEEEAAKYPHVRHPMVRINPVNGRKALYVSSYAAFIEGMDEEEGCKLLEDLLAFAGQPDFVYDHKWKVGDLIMYDNRACLHRATEYEISKYPRILSRTNVGDNQPTL
jgi:alpha-ketoglutarate-dependent 2,4-dichlorophenoxyacetate dioxygenase